MARRSRSTETRDADARPDIESNHQAALYFPRHKWPKGMAMRWVRVGVRETEDKENWARAYRSGWRPVPPEIAPEYAIPGPDGKLPTDGIIRVANHILCQKPLADYDRDRRDQEQRTKDQGRQLEDFVRDNPDSDVPRFNRSSETVRSIEPARAFKD